MGFGENGLIAHMGCEDLRTITLGLWNPMNQKRSITR